VKRFRDGEEEEYLLAETRIRFKKLAKESLFYLDAEPEAPEVEKYSYKYLMAEKRPAFKNQISKLNISIAFSLI
jgi:hypothetical protein